MLRLAPYVLFGVQPSRAPTLGHGAHDTCIYCHILTIPLSRLRCSALICNGPPLAHFLWASRYLGGDSMRKCALVAVAIAIHAVAFSSLAWCDEAPQPFESTTEPEACAAPSAAESFETAGRGCCSHHGGVCGCSNGRNMCCDGALSPSCRCAADDRDSVLN